MIQKRYISYNGISFIKDKESSILKRLGTDADFYHYFSIIDQYKSLESKYDTIIYKNNKLVINNKTPYSIAKTILNKRIEIQNLQMEATDHYILKNNMLKFIPKYIDRKKQLSHEHIISMYRKYVGLEDIRFVYHVNE